MGIVSSRSVVAGRQTQNALERSVSVIGPERVFFTLLTDGTLNPTWRRFDSSANESFPFGFAPLAGTC